MRRTALLLAICLTGCAGYRPIVDMQGVDPNRYYGDLAQCQQYAEQVDVGGSAAGSAAAGAVLGAALGALFGNRQSAGQLGAAYGLIGGAAGAAQGGIDQKQVIRNCMAGRGYRVLM